MAKKLKYKFPRLLALKKQTATENVDKVADSRHKALKPGLRRSKNGTLYTETRANRSDKNPTQKL